MEPLIRDNDLSVEELQLFENFDAEGREQKWTLPDLVYNARAQMGNKWLKYCGWSRTRSNAYYERRAAVTPQVLYDRITAVFTTLSVEAIMELSMALNADKRPLISLGACDDYRYRLRPDCQTLSVSDEDPLGYKRDRRPTVDTSILSMFENWESRQNATMDRTSEDSGVGFVTPSVPTSDAAREADSDHTSGGPDQPLDHDQSLPLLFLQLGSFQHQHRSSRDYLDWTNTGFTFVVNLFTKEPWLIYNNRAYNEDTEEYGNGYGSNGSLPHGPTRRFSFARLHRAGSDAAGLDSLAELLISDDPNQSIVVDQHHQTPDDDVMLLYPAHRRREGSIEIARSQEARPFVKPDASLRV